jgi:pyruvate/2-oxoglutarate dehydrogenase complex dihydrolipoamide acyltransferase (E2) component
MSVKINFPKSGMGIEEGVVVRWCKNVGQPVQEGEVLLEIETVKALQEVLAPVSGHLANIAIAEGETASVNSTLGTIEPSKE